ncbi:MAG: polyphosphate polymerase domain-containing protein [Spirochaetales bacterium]|nr:polyphosphate polymerase domain-containing protein [Spirochaetales bacterium]
MTEEIEQKLEGFDTIALKDLGSVALLDRVDTKYVGHVNQLAKILPALQKEYKVLYHQGVKQFAYETTYLDTSDFQFYRAHHQGRANRYKVRTRGYRDTGVYFDEIKFKDNRKKTYKTRVQRDERDTVVDVDFLDFIAESPELETLRDDLKPVLDVDYTRMTFVNNQYTERITLDYALRFNKEQVNSQLDNLFILEVKKSSLNQKSVMESILKNHKIYPSRISKYCVGMVMTNKSLKHNRFKPLIRNISKINSEVS